MNKFIWAGLALQICAVPAFAQSTPIPAAPVTTPPPAGAQPPTGGPNSPPMTEPANTIDHGTASPNHASAMPNADHVSTTDHASVTDHGGLTPGANSFTESQARNRLRQNGFAQVSQLTKDNDGIWRGSATKNGSQVHVSVDFKGHISAN